MALGGRIEDLKRHVRSRLRSDLPKSLTYHGLHHTLSDVLPAAIRICGGESLSSQDTELVLAAALLHDIGFVEQYRQNEAIGARIASETLPGFGFSSHETARVRDLILATELHEDDGVWMQVPGLDPLKRILCDADLDNLGREDFFEVSRTLREELANQGTRFDDEQWIHRQIAFLSRHEWFTRTQRMDREEGKRRNLERLILERRTLA